MMDIAKMSGVSIATVSRVLNQNGRYSAETEKRVMDIVKKYNYIINQVKKRQFALICTPILDTRYGGISL